MHITISKTTHYVLRTSLCWLTEMRFSVIAPISCDWWILKNLDCNKNYPCFSYDNDAANLSFFYYATFIAPLFISLINPCMRVPHPHFSPSLLQRRKVMGNWIFFLRTVSLAFCVFSQSLNLFCGILKSQVFFNIGGGYIYVIARNVVVGWMNIAHEFLRPR